MQKFDEKLQTTFPDADFECESGRAFVGLLRTRFDRLLHWPRDFDQVTIYDGAVHTNLDDSRADKQCDTMTDKYKNCKARIVLELGKIVAGRSGSMVNHVPGRKIGWMVQVTTHANGEIRTGDNPAWASETECQVGEI